MASDAYPTPGQELHAYPDTWRSEAIHLPWAKHGWPAPNAGFRGAAAFGQFLGRCFHESLGSLLTCCGSNSSVGTRVARDVHWHSHNSPEINGNNGVKTVRSVEAAGKKEHL